MTAALDRLDGPAALRASALETVDAVSAARLVGPLLAIFEPMLTTGHPVDEWLARALDDDDPLIRNCAALVRARRGGDTDTMDGSLTTISVIERALILRRIPLFAALTPSDLEGLARIGEEQGYADGETIVREGELGDELHVVIDGVIRVLQDTDGSEREIARRGAGEVVGEMSIITRRPRMASIVADGDVRTIRIGQVAFESMLRERPELAIGVIRVLADRLAERPGTG